MSNALILSKIALEHAEALREDKNLDPIRSPLRDLVRSVKAESEDASILAWKAGAGAIGLENVLKPYPALSKALIAPLMDASVKAYAGIGSRETPDHVLPVMTATAEILRQRKWTLRSGGAAGADHAFEKAVVQGGRVVDGEIFLAWEVRNSKKGLPDKTIRQGYVVPSITPKLRALVTNFHPNPSALSQSALELMSRNGCQIFGQTVDRPVRAVVAWTKGGQGAGGTGQALRIAKHYGIPVIDLGHMRWRNTTPEHIADAVEGRDTMRARDIEDVLF